MHSVADGPNIFRAQINKQIEDVQDVTNALNETTLDEIETLANINAISNTKNEESSH